MTNLRLTGQSKLAGKREVETIIILEDNLKLHQQRLQQLKKQLGEDFAPEFDAIELGIQLSDTRASISRMADVVQRKRAALDIN